MFLLEVLKEFCRRKKDEIECWWDCDGRYIFEVIRFIMTIIVSFFVLSIVIGQIEWWIAGGVPSWFETEEVLLYIHNQMFWAVKFVIGFNSLMMLLVLLLVCIFIFSIGYGIYCFVKWIGSNAIDSWKYVDSQQKKSLDNDKL